jgi:Domain of unknown function (DUF927)
MTTGHLNSQNSSTETITDRELKELFAEIIPEVMPDGWTYDGKSNLCTVTIHQNSAENKPVFLGKLEVTGSSEDVFTGQSSLQVRFKSQKRFVTVEAPRSELSRKKGVLDFLSARGAPVHDDNASKVAKFLTEYAKANEERIPHERTASRYGFTPSNDLVLPVGLVSSLGESESIRFVSGIGAPRAKTGINKDAYRDALEEILSWGREAWVILAALGFSLSSPFLERFKPRRNPVVYFAGDSGAGKTTAARFAVAVWGLGAPLEMELGRTTKAGILQTLEGLGGLPLFGDEAHSNQDPETLEATVYQFGNGQSYTKGGKDGKALGGVTMNGSMFLAGEAMPEFANAGSHRRVLFLRVDEHKPLAAPVGSSLGASRAEMLEKAWLEGSGHCGEMFARGVLSDWDTYAALVKEHRGMFTNLGAWDVPLAAMLASVQTLCKLYDLELPEEILTALIGEPPSVLTGARLEHEPAVTAWESLQTILGGSKTVVENEIHFLEYRGERIAWKDKKSTALFVMTSAKAITEALEGKSWLQRFGSEWIRRQWIQATAKDGKSSISVWMPGNNANVRVIAIPIKSSPQGGN